MPSMIVDGMIWCQHMLTMRYSVGSKHPTVISAANWASTVGLTAVMRDNYSVQGIHADLLATNSRSESTQILTGIENRSARSVQDIYCDSSDISNRLPFHHY